ncbi:MAG: nicotinate phosphoribosyltransferase [Firmicutes bacterium]|nr:nicotinate phosphoribosyltransferase [Bacillota bacterium]
MTSQKLTFLEAVQGLKITPTRKFHSATHDEIANGATTDIYFVRTYEILSHLGKLDSHVTAEIFPRRDGVMAGTKEVVNLLRDQGDVRVWALDEGEEFVSREVIMRIEGSYGQFGLYETVILGMLASPSGWATAARECKEAAGDKDLFSFGARHVHPAVAPVMERAALIGGANGASCIIGAKMGGKEPSGTVPHAAFMIVGDTVEVAKTYHAVMPADAPRVILVDTFKDEAEETLRVAQALGDALDGVRLDTPGERGGVTPGLVHEIRNRLDLAGFRHVRILVSGGITPERIVELGNAGADAFGVGSYITSTPPIDMTMDLKEVDGKPLAKRGRIPGKTHQPRLRRQL